MNLRQVLGWTSLLLLATSGCSEKVPAPEKSGPEEEGLPVFTPAPASSGLLPGPVSAEPSSFAAVAQYLDTNGSFYLYLSTEGFLKRAALKAQQLAPLVMSAAKLGEADNLRAQALWNSLSQLTQSSGLQDISGVGLSSVALRPGYFHSKWMVHHYAHKGRGFLWQIPAASCNALDLIAYLPKNTALAASSNLTFGPLWNALLEEASDNQTLARELQDLRRKVEQLSGFTLERLLQTVGPNFSVVVTLDKRRKVTLPLGAGGNSLLNAEPALAVLVQIREPAVFSRIESELGKLPGLVTADQAGFKMRILPASRAIPFVRPAVAWNGELLILASEESLLREMTEVKEGKTPGLALQPDFKVLFDGMPKSGCQFYVSAPLFQRTVADLQLAIQQSRVDPAIGRILQWARASMDERWVCGVVENTPEGLVGNLRGGAGPARFLERAAAVPIALGSSAVMPVLERAHKRSQAARVLEDLRSLQAALDQFAQDRHKPPGTAVTFDDLKPYFKPGSPLFEAENQDLLGNPFNNGLPYTVGTLPKVSAATLEALSAVAPATYWLPFK